MEEGPFVLSYIKDLRNKVSKGKISENLMVGLLNETSKIWASTNYHPITIDKGPFVLSNIKDLQDKVIKEEITETMMVDLLNESTVGWYLKIYESQPKKEPIYYPPPPDAEALIPEAKEEYLKDIKEFIKETEDEEFYVGDISVRQKYEWFVEEMMENHKNTHKKKWFVCTKKVNGHAWEHFITWVDELTGEMKQFVLEDDGY